MSEVREIPQRELRNNVAAVLREVAAGNTVRVTVRGRPVAELVPVSDPPPFAPRAEVERLLAEAPLDAGFTADLDRILGQTVEDL